MTTEQPLVLPQKRPLLAWLGLQRQRAHDSGDTEAAAKLQRRINLVLQTPQKAQ